MPAHPWIAALAAGAVAQGVKLGLVVLRTGRLTPEALFRQPGMPSTWSAVCTALCTVVGHRDGIASLGFAMTVAFSCLVIYDSLGLRRSAGRQAQLLNAIARDLELHRKERAGRHLRELLGETPAQVLGGILAGATVGLLFLA